MSRGILLSVFHKFMPIPGSGLESCTLIMAYVQLFSYRELLSTTLGLAYHPVRVRLRCVDSAEIKLAVLSLEISKNIK